MHEVNAKLKHRNRLRVLFRNNLIYHDNGINKHASRNGGYYGVRDRIAETKCHNGFSRGETAKNLSILQNIVFR